MTRSLSICLGAALCAVGCDAPAPSAPGSSDAGPVAATDAGPRADDDAGPTSPGRDAGPSAPGADAGPACSPACGAAECGDDGCGGECGACGAGELCVGGRCEVAEATSCPPAGPFGTRVGDTAPDFTLMDCDGNPHTLHGLCDAEVVWLFELADWCPPCRRFAQSRANEVYDAYASESFAAFTIISENSSFGPPTQEQCREIRDRYGLRMPVLYDPEGRFRRALDVPVNEVHVVLERGAVIDWIGHYGAGEVSDRIAAAFAD